MSTTDSRPTPLPLDFYTRDAETVARALLGCTLVRVGEAGVTRVRIVETEAYVGTHDRASHASRGRTKRTAVMFGPPGRAYVYLIYGMYDMLNVVTSTEGDPQAVLVRAAEPLDSLEARLDGPGRLTRALDITRALNRHDLRRPPLYLAPGRPPEEVATSPRIGIDYAEEWVSAPLRFYDPSSEHVSRR